MEKKTKYVPIKPPTSVKGAIMINCTSNASATDDPNNSDGRKTNRGSSIRKKITNLQKARMIESCERAAENLTVAEWVRRNNVGR